MEKKRSVGVTIFASFYIIVGLSMAGWTISWFVHPIIENGSTSLAGFIIGLTLIIIPSVIVIGNIAVLFLKEWGRKVHLFFVWLLTGLIIFYSCMFAGAELCSKSMNKKPPILVILLALVVILAFLIPVISSVIFFTRPKVKEQFK